MLLMKTQFFYPVLHYYCEHNKVVIHTHPTVSIPICQPQCIHYFVVTSFPTSIVQQRIFHHEAIRCGSGVIHAQIIFQLR